MTTVLIADDNADHRMLLSLALHRLGHRAVEATDSDSAMAAATGGGIGAILLDVRMPGESGIDLCRRLRAQPATATTPIMFVSAEVSDSRILDALAAGADDFLPKPFHRAELGIRLENLLRPRAGLIGRSAAAAQAALLAARGSIWRPALLEGAVRRIA